MSDTIMKALDTINEIAHALDYVSYSLIVEQLNVIKDEITTSSISPSHGIKEVQVTELEEK